MNFPFICSNIPAAPANGVYILSVDPIFQSYGSYHDFIDRGLLLTRKVLNQVFLVVKVKSFLRRYYGRGLVNCYEYLCHKGPRMCSVCRNHKPVLSSFMIYYRVCNTSITTGATCREGTADTCGALGFFPD